MAVCGIAVNIASIAMVEGKIQKLNQNLNISSEIKWSNTKARRDSGHRAYADLLKALVGAGNIHFHIRFQRTSDWDHRRAGPRRKTDTVSRAFYQLLLHRPVKFYGSKCDVHVRPDAGECTEKLHEYMDPMNTEARRSEECGVSCVKSVEICDSKKTPALQLLDVTLGGLAALRNGRHLKEETSDAKKALALHIHRQYQNIDLSIDSTRDQKNSIYGMRCL